MRPLMRRRRSRLFAHGHGRPRWPVIALATGTAFAAAAMAVAGWDVLASASGGAANGAGLRPLGELWYRIDPGSLNLVQAVIERYIWPPLWDPGIVTVLQQPALAVFGVPAAVLLLAGWIGRRRF